MQSISFESEKRISDLLTKVKELETIKGWNEEEVNNVVEDKDKVIKMRQENVKLKDIGKA